MYCKLFRYGTYIRLNAHSGVTVGHRIYHHTAPVLKITHISPGSYNTETMFHKEKP